MIPLLDHSRAAGLLCAGTDRCEECGAALIGCSTCGGVGYHLRACPVFVGQARRRHGELAVLLDDGRLWSQQVTIYELSDQIAADCARFEVMRHAAPQPPPWPPLGPEAIADYIAAVHACNLRNAVDRRALRRLPRFGRPSTGVL